MDAYMRGYRLWVPRDCTAAESDAARDAALRQMAHVFKCSVRKKRLGETAAPCRQADGRSPAFTPPRRACAWPA